MLEDCVVASMDFEVTQELKEIKLPVIDLFEYLDGHATIKNLDLAYSSCEAFAEAFRGKFLYMGCDIADIAQDDLIYPFLNLITVQSIVAKTLEEHRPNNVIHFSEMNQIPPWDLAPTPPDLFNAVVKICALKRGIKTLSLRIRHSEVELQSEHVNGYNDQVELSQSFEPFYKEQPVISFGDKYREQENFLEKTQKFQIEDFILISDHGQDLMCNLSIYTVRCLPFNLKHYRRVWQQAIKANKPYFLKNIPQIANALSSSILGFFWERYLDLLHSWAKHYALGLFLGRTLSPRLVITSWDYDGGTRCFQKSLKNLGVNILTVDHVGMGHSASHMINRKAFSDVVVWGEHDLQGQLKWRKENADVTAVGSLRKDHSALTSLRSHYKKKENSQNLLRAPLKIIIFTTQMTSLFATWVNIAAFQRSWDQLLDLFNRHHEWDVIIKPHPYYDYNAWYKSTKFSQLSNLKIINASPKDVLSEADVAVIHNCNSTVAIDAIGMDVPVIYLNDAKPQGLPPTPFEQYGLILSANSVKELEALIEILFSDEVFQREVMLKEKAFFNKILTATGDEAVARMVEVVNQKISCQPKQQSSKADLALFNLALFIDAVRTKKVDWNECRKSVANFCLVLPRKNPESYGFACYADLGTQLLGAIVRAQVTHASSLGNIRLFRVFLLLPREYRPTILGVCSVFLTICRYMLRGLNVFHLFKAGYSVQ